MQSDTTEESQVIPPGGPVPGSEVSLPMAPKIDVSIVRDLSLASASTLVVVVLLAIVSAVVIPALASPSTIDPLLHARWIVDYTVGNPVLLIGGVLLWRRQRLGFVVAAGLLSLSGANGIAFAVGGVLGALLTGTPVDALVIAALSFMVLAVFLRGEMPGPSSEAENGQSVTFANARRR
jgi:hypothetical protein